MSTQMAAGDVIPPSLGKSHDAQQQQRDSIACIAMSTSPTDTIMMNHSIIKDEDNGQVPTTASATNTITKHTVSFVDMNDQQNNNNVDVDDDEDDEMETEPSATATTEDEEIVPNNDDDDDLDEDDNDNDQDNDHSTPKVKEPLLFDNENNNNNDDDEDKEMDEDEIQDDEDEIDEDDQEQQELDYRHNSSIRYSSNNSNQSYERPLIYADKFVRRELIQVIEYLKSTSKGGDKPNEEVIVHEIHL
ncbi:hypothetical protein DFA_04602 [Cavenderia fasciculata]|uniref:Uncharacterized protein n=1 Tax=Cavenderia fasciculata TaxID=261658 RepID=F4PQ11_CACFS|nr:uncharacterized protein DFA_04602 [Cavenderia fasciculata]EGG22474.1 hypothetical protein DFA_04602 [Cavenderia fasciculata]|eukprot:XP_004360325.1 hypothetical protein DFA_04602 [Cavenderia fasciculata]